MRAITHALLDDVVLPPGGLIDLGCGGGALLSELRSLYPNRPLVGLDQHPLAVAQSTRNLPSGMLQGDLERLPVADGCAALILALDSFDQASVNLSTAVRESRRVLCDGGVLLMKVSAGSWLYGPHDVAFNTGRRYDRGSLVDLLRSTGFHVQRCTYANLLVGLPVVPFRLLQRVGLIPLMPSLYAGRMSNRLLEALLTVEARMLSHANLPMGLSLFVLACKDC